MITNIEITLQESLRPSSVEGEATGLAKGKLEIARKLLLRGHTTDMISELTGLPIANIDKLAKEMY